MCISGKPYAHVKKDIATNRSGSQKTLLVVSIIVSIANGSFAANAVSNIITLVIDGLMFWIANNIKTMPQKTLSRKTFVIAG